MRTRYPVRSNLLVGAAALAVVLAGCGAGDPGASAPAPDAPGSSDAALPEAEEEQGEEAVEDEEQAPNPTAQDDAGTPSPTAQDDGDASAQGDEHDGGHDDTADPVDTPPEVDGKPVIEIDMFEFGYDPASITIPAGEPTILRFTNHGEAEHEAMIGDHHMQEEFAASDDHGNHGGDGSAGHHGDTMAVTVAAGDTADLEVVIDEPGTWFIGCHLPGHYEAGMKASLEIIPLEGG